MALSLGVIGLGRMAQVILYGLLDSGQFKPEEVLGVVGQKKSIKNVLDQSKHNISVVHAQDITSKEVWSAPVKILATSPGFSKGKILSPAAIL